MSIVKGMSRVLIIFLVLTAISDTSTFTYDYQRSFQYCQNSWYSSSHRFPATATSVAPSTLPFFCKRPQMEIANCSSANIPENDGYEYQSIDRSDVKMTDDDTTNISEDDPYSSMNDENGEMVQGYEYLHPDIAAMFLTKAQNEESNSVFLVDPDALLLRRGQDNGWENSTHTLTIHQLAGLADKCDRVVFAGSTNHDHMTKTVAGLICLSKLTKSPGSKQNCLDSSLEKNPEENGGHDPSILAACMIASNLLESSIRAIVRESRERNDKESMSIKRNNRHGYKSDSKSPKGAPLLRDMIQEISAMGNFTLEPMSSSSLPHQRAISAADLAPILRALLLPTKAGGINLRNLISHGFLSTVDRRWFALILVLIQTLDRLLESSINECEKVGGKNGDSPSLTKYNTMAKEVRNGKHILLQYGQSLQEFEHQTVDFIPPSHMPLLRFSLYILAPTLQHSLNATKQRDESMENVSASDRKEHDPVPSLTSIFTTIMCSLLEHSLRLLWCSSNNRPRDRNARPSEYYVTLDGHGQRDKHEVLISPYLRDDITRNLLVPVIGAPACAMLSDLFAAPSDEAPNIRSAVCHGTWDAEIIKELEGLAATTENSRNCELKSNPQIIDAACALVSCLDLISSKVSGEPRISSYRPVYTHTSTFVRNLSEIIRDLNEFDSLISNNASIGDCIRTMELQQPKLCDDLRPLKVELEVIENLAFDLSPTMGISDDQLWSIDDTYSEHKANIALAGNVAALALLSDTSHAVKKYLVEVQERADTLVIHPKNTKDRRMQKTAARFCSAAMIARDFYAWVVLVSVNQVSCDDTSNKGLNREDCVRATERSRMAISTFDSYITINLDRSLKALQQYLQGKAVKKVILLKNQIVSGTQDTAANEDGSNKASPN